MDKTIQGATLACKHRTLRMGVIVCPNGSTIVKDVTYFFSDTRLT